jgi:hypothetical protein
MSRQSRPRQSECRIVAQARVRGDQQFRVLGYTKDASPSGEPYIAVRVGSLLIYVEDIAALDSFLQAWSRAERFGDRVFGTPFDTPERLDLQADCCLGP